MEVEAILGFVLLVCFVLALFIVLTARIASARRNLSLIHIFARFRSALNTPPVSFPMRLKRLRLLVCPCW